VATTSLLGTKILVKYFFPIWFQLPQLLVLIEVGAICNV
jgi:hypothetical protein